MIEIKNNAIDVFQDLLAECDKLVELVGADAAEKIIDEAKKISTSNLQSL